MKYHVGTMIEIPRAAVTADEIAREAEFFSFGTNDLTQMTFGFSRDDAAKFLDAYYEHKIYEFDPFAKLDQTGVGARDSDGRREGPQHPPGHQARHLRATRRRSVVDRVLPQDRPELRLLLALPRADRPPRRRAGSDHQPLIVQRQAKSSARKDVREPFIRKRPFTNARSGQRSMVALTASMNAWRIPLASRASTPRMVVPRGEQTPSLISAGIMPVSSCILPVPSAICAASR